MKLKKIIKYKSTAIMVYDNGLDHFCYEYKFKQDGVIVYDRSSTSSIAHCINMAKDDYDLEEN